MVYYAIVSTYLIESFVYANKVLGGEDLNENLVFNVFLHFFKLVWIIILIGRSFKSTSSLNIKIINKKFLLFYIVFILTIIMGYSLNKFIITSLIRDIVLYGFYLVLLQQLIILIGIDPNKAKNKILSIVKILLCLHLIGIAILTMYKFDLNFVVDKIFVNPLVFRNYEESRLYFFSFAGNEEAYSVLIFLTIIYFNKKTKFIVIAAVFCFFILLYLGSRTAFFSFLLGIMFILANRSKNKSKKYWTTIILAFIFIINLQYIITLIDNAFIYANPRTMVTNIDLFSENDNFYSRFQIMWIPIVLNGFQNVGNFIFGVTTNGLRPGGIDIGTDYRSPHNALVFFFGTMGFLGLMIYLAGFLSIFKNLINIKKCVTTDKDERNFYVLLCVIIFFIIYNMMNNSFSTQGMLIYVLIIAFIESIYKTKILENQKYNNDRRIFT